MKTFFVTLSLVTLSSCALKLNPPKDIVVAPVETIDVFKTVVQKCIDKMPPLPELVVVPSTGVDQQALARIKREQALVIYVNEMRVVMKPCVKESK